MRTTETTTMPTVVKTNKQFCEEQYAVIDAARDELQSLAGEYHEKFDALSETLQDGERGAQLSDIAEELEAVVGLLDDALGALDDLDFD